MPKFKVGDVVQLKEDDAQIAQVEEIRNGKYVFDFEGISYLTPINEIERDYEPIRIVRK